MTAVLPCGGILSSRPAPRRATGPDLATLFLGTHGRFGIVGDATLRVHPWPAERVVLSGAFDPAYLSDLRQVLLSGVSPHLLEVEVDPGGTADLLVSLHGERWEVRRDQERIEEAIGASLDALPGLPPTEAPDVVSVTVPWTGLFTFLDVWKGGKRRRPFRIVEVTMHSLRIAGGGTKARDAALAACGICSRETRDGGRQHLLGVKPEVDPGSILGKVVGGR